MRHLLQPRVLQSAALAAALTTLACYPRLALWPKRPFPIWYLEATIFLCCIMLWGFVFAWHRVYTGRPVFIANPGLVPFAIATALGLATATASHLWIDPVLQPKFPEEYPPDLLHWLAGLPFILAFNQLFLVFAPVDWLMRLAKNRWLAAAVTGLLAAALLLLKIHKLSAAVPPHMLALMLLGRMFSGFVVVWLYLRGGIGLVSWWTLLQESRLLLDLLP